MKEWILARRVSIEARKIAGHWEIDNLIVILDAKDVILNDGLSKQQRKSIGKKYESMVFKIFQTDGKDIRNFIILRQGK